MLVTADWFIEFPQAATNTIGIGTSSTDKSSASSASTVAATQEGLSTTTEQPDSSVTAAENTTQLAPIDQQSHLTSETTSSAPIQTYALSVISKPTNARVRILNIPDR